MALALPIQSLKSEDLVKALADFSAQIKETTKETKKTEDKKKKKESKEDKKIKEMTDMKEIIINLSERGKIRLEAQKEALKLMEESAKREKKIDQWIKEGRKGARYLKLKNRLTMTYHKWIVKNKFFKTLTTSLKKISAGAGSFIVKFLKFLFLATLFPGLLPMVINLFITVAEAILKHLGPFVPKMIKMFINIFTVILPKAIIKILDTLFPAIAKMFNAWADELGAESTLGNILRYIGKFFTFMSTFLKDYIPQIIAFGIAAKLFGFTNILKFLGKTLVSTGKLLGKFALGFASKMKGMFAREGLDSKGFTKKAGVGRSLFTGLKKWIPKILMMIGGALLTAGSAILTGFIAVITSPITLIVAAIAGIVFLIYKYRKAIWKGLKKAWKTTKSWASGAWDKMKDFGRYLASLPSKIWTSITTTVSDFWTYMKKAPGKIWDTVVKYASNMWVKTKVNVKFALMSIKDMFKGLMDWFSGIGSLNVTDMLSSKKREKAAIISGIERKQIAAGTRRKEFSKVEFEKLLKMSKAELEMKDDKISKKREEQVKGQLKEEMSKVKTINQNEDLKTYKTSESKRAGL